MHEGPRVEFLIYGEKVAELVIIIFGARVEPLNYTLRSSSVGVQSSKPEFLSNYAKGGGVGGENSIFCKKMT